ncbi:Na/Pi cotransporter family protein [Rhodohalobacter barkolensis]|uniref:Na/Pi cotransporter family protein n=1 Tax=Rhodohalobacter barkolensis TaxID=2053187 RepID=A0A2N0VJ17_9BACT|nr:Na/Pi symporter [Rhodohalobacter barkolensis]PKD44154.1 Na/Pi cotransporter family protein [Rhodohalobacter barkolensis]
MSFFSQFELWTFFAGLGIFLFGMHMMEESIRILSGAAFKSIIRRSTGTRVKAIFSGMFSTAILQSSSAVSLMVLAFVGAGILNLVQAISVMMGAKIGTTATAWVVAVFGFKFNIEVFSLPMIGIGGLGMIALARSPKYVNISKFLVAFGFLFMGLDYMKSSVDQVSNVIDSEIFTGYGILVYALAGLVLTAIMQSSSATIAIVLTMLFSGVIDFSAAASMVIGANVGTTVTVILGAVGGIHTKKQAAVSQLIFTTGTAFLALLLLPVLTWIVLDLFSFNDNPVLGLALFHSLFNIGGVLLYYPIIPQLAKRVELWIPERTVSLSSYIHKTDPEITEAGLVAFKKEILCQLQYTLSFLEPIFRLNKSKQRIDYSDLERYHAEIFEYYTNLHKEDLNQEIAEDLDKLLRVSRSFMNSSKNLHESVDELKVLESETDEVHQKASNLIKERIELLLQTGRMLDVIETEERRNEVISAVEELYQFIESVDKEFIKMCSTAVTEADFKKVEITFLLMLNRVITQSCRMIVFGMRTLLLSEEEQSK